MRIEIWKPKLVIHLYIWCLRIKICHKIDDILLLFQLSIVGFWSSRIFYVFQAVDKLCIVLEYQCFNFYTYHYRRLACTGKPRFRILACKAYARDKPHHMKHVWQAPPSVVGETRTRDLWAKKYHFTARLYPREHHSYFLIRHDRLKEETQLVRSCPIAISTLQYLHLYNNKNL